MQYGILEDRRLLKHLIEQCFDNYWRYLHGKLTGFDEFYEKVKSLEYGNRRLKLFHAISLFAQNPNVKVVGRTYSWNDKGYKPKNGIRPMFILMPDGHSFVSRFGTEVLFLKPGYLWSEQQVVPV